MVDGDSLRALHLAGTGVGAVSKAQLVHLAQHGLYAAGSLYLALGKESQLAHLGSSAGKQDQELQGLQSERRILKARLMQVR